MHIGMLKNSRSGIAGLRGRPASAALNLYIVFAILLVFVPGVPAQDDPGCKTKEAQQLAFMKGEWTVSSRFRVDRNPEKWEQSMGRSLISEEFPGCLWKEEFSGMRHGKPLRVLGLYSFSNISGKLQHTWAHSQHGVLTAYEGEAEADSIILKSNVEVRGTLIIRRKVIEKRQNGFRVRTERSLDGGKTWDSGWYLEYSQTRSP